MEYAHINREYDFDELCEIVGAVAAKRGILRVYLFGSRARGDNTAGSDYDFCIIAPEDYGLFEIGGFYSDLRKALGVDIDVVCEESLEEDFSREVLRDRRLVYEA